MYELLAALAKAIMEILVDETVKLVDTPDTVVSTPPPVLGSLVVVDDDDLVGKFHKL